MEDNKNFNTLKILLSYFGEDSRLPQIKKLISEYTPERIIESPFAHKRGDYVGVYPGGWVDFVASFVTNSIAYARYLNPDGKEDLLFTESDILSSCFFSSLYKLGHPNKRPMYLPQDNQWRRDNLGEYYRFNEDYSNIDPNQITFQILNDYDIKLNEYEFEAVYNSHSFMSHSGAIKLVKGTHLSKLPFIMTVNYIKAVYDIKVKEQIEQEDF